MFSSLIKFSMEREKESKRSEALNNKVENENLCACRERHFGRSHFTPPDKKKVRKRRRK
jgi:hypothetical protein